MLSEADLVEVSRLIAATAGSPEERQAALEALARWAQPLLDEVRRLRPKKSGRGFGDEHFNAVLNEATVADIKGLLAKGVPGKRIAAFYNVTAMAISQIRRGRTWSHVSPNMSMDVSLLESASRSTETT